MAARVTIAGVDHLDDLNQAQPIQIDLLQNGRSRMRFTCLTTYQPARFAEVVAYGQDGTTPIYGGVILQRSMAGISRSAEAPEMSCECVGFEAYLDWCYVDLTYAADFTLQDVLDDLIAALPAAYGITLDATDYSGITLAACSWRTMRVSDLLRELCDRTGRVYRVSPAKVLSMPLPGGVSAPADFIDGTPNCEDLTWQDAPTPATTTVKLICGTGQVVYPQTWIADGVATSWVADIPAAGPGGYWVVTLTPPGNLFCTVDDGFGGGMFSWDWTTRTLTSNIGAPDADTVLSFPYTAQYPFTVTATIGGSPPPTPDIQAIYTREDVFGLLQAQEIADGLLATLGGSPRTIEARTRVEGWEPGQSLAVDLAGREVDATFAVTDVSILWETAGSWVYTVRATELSVFGGNYLDQWRALLAGSSSGATASAGSSSGTTVIGAGALPVYDLGGSRFHAVQVPS